MLRLLSERPKGTFNERRRRKFHIKSVQTQREMAKGYRFRSQLCRCSRREGRQGSSNSASCESPGGPEGTSLCDWVLLPQGQRACERRWFIPMWPGKTWSVSVALWIRSLLQINCQSYRNIHLFHKMQKLWLRTSNTTIPVRVPFKVFTMIIAWVWPVVD